MIVDAMDQRSALMVLCDDLTEHGFLQQNKRPHFRERFASPRFPTLALSKSGCGSKGTPSSQPVCKLPDMKLNGQRPQPLPNPFTILSNSVLTARFLRHFLLHKKEYHLMVILRKKHMRFFLRRHYPHQVKGRRTYLPLSLLGQAPLCQKV